MGVNEIKWTGQGKQQSTTRCYHSHPALPITVGDTTYQVYGGSCSTPVWDECDVYIGLDNYMAEHEQRLPWTEGWAIHYKIVDRSVPPNASQFVDLVEWLADRVIDNKRVHVGCIGGHGRTGLVLSALVAQMTGMPDPISYVRKHYCTKAVESTEQVTFLTKHFGAAKVEPSKKVTNWAAQQSSTYRNRKVPPMQHPSRIWGAWIVEG